MMPMMFSHFTLAHRIVSIHPDELVEDAIEAFKNRETIVLEESTEELKGNTEESGEESGAKIIAATEQDGDATTVKGLMVHLQSAHLK